jgi:hypothetical protein
MEVILWIIPDTFEMERFVSTQESCWWWVTISPSSMFLTRCWSMTDKTIEMCEMIDISTAFFKFSPVLISICSIMHVRSSLPPQLHYFAWHINPKYSLTFFIVFNFEYNQQSHLSWLTQNANRADCDDWVDWELRAVRCRNSATPHYQQWSEVSQVRLTCRTSVGMLSWNLEW